MQLSSKSHTRGNIRRNFIVLAALFVLINSGFSLSAKSLSAEDLPAPLDKMVLEDGDTIVLLGDSITHQCLYTQYFENYIYTRFPNKRIRIHNAGVGGAKAWDALQRFEKDVAAYKPKYVPILLGMNDGRYTPFNQEYFETYQQDMAKVIDKIKAIGATPILMTPTMFDARARRMNPRGNPDEASISQYNAVMAYYGAWVREVAVHSGYGYVDMYGPLNQLTVNQRKQNPKFTMIKDAVHPNEPGQVVMAFAMVNDLGLPRGLSSIRIQNRQGKGIQAKATGGKVTDLKETEDGLEFNWLADSLPWVLPANADLGVSLTKLGHKLTREALEIHDLKPGYYRLAIDDQEIGIFHSTVLERHIELQGNKQTPQYQQAAKVAELNAVRNNGPVRKLRGEWSRFQGYARTLAAKPEEDPAALEAWEKKIAAYKKQIDTMDQRVEQANAEARKIEDEIFKINQPVCRKFSLKRVPAPKRKGAVKKKAAQAK